MGLFFLAESKEISCALETPLWDYTIRDIVGSQSLSSLTAIGKTFFKKKWFLKTYKETCQEKVGSTLGVQWIPSIYLSECMSPIPDRLGMYITNWWCLVISLPANNSTPVSTSLDAKMGETLLDVFCAHHNHGNTTCMLLKWASQHLWAKMWFK